MQHGSEYKIKMLWKTGIIRILTKLINLKEQFFDRMKTKF